MKKYKQSGSFLPGLTAFLLILLLSSISSISYSQTRTEIDIPDISGYLTVKCDFHLHTVFSDGSVWPTNRADEIWREGLDAFSITDHIEYKPHRDDVSLDNDRSYEIAKPVADAYGLSFIKGSEITRGMPPGHLNAIFLNDANLLDTPEPMDAIKAAIDQGAFVFWNHPGWDGQQPDGISRWYTEHTQLLENGWMHGIEIVNGSEYYPRAHQWCLENNLTMIGNTDAHGPLHYNGGSSHRTMTLVFADNKSPEAIKEALIAHRTAIYKENLLIGEEQYLRAIFEASIEILTPEVTVTGTGSAAVQIRNNSDIDFELAANGLAYSLSFSEHPVLYAHKTVIIELQGTTETISGSRKVSLPFLVNNLYIEPEKGMPVDLEINVTYIPTITE